MIPAGEQGNLLYRWGNPAPYGGEGVQRLFGQHDAKWIIEGLPGEGNVLVFNNGDNSRPYSSIEEIDLETGEVVWHYEADETSDFFSDHISGAQRLPNGNTLICSGADARIFEVSPEGEIVWDYSSPYEVISKNGTKNSIFRAEKYAPDYEGLSQLD